MDILNNNIGKMEIAPRKPWVTKAMINKMPKRRKLKTTKVKVYTGLDNQLRRETDRSNKANMEEMCEEIIDLQKKGRYDLMYQKAQQLGEELGKPYKHLEVKTTKAT